MSRNVEYVINVLNGGTRIAAIKHIRPLSSVEGNGTTTCEFLVDDVKHDEMIAALLAKPLWREGHTRPSAGRLVGGGLSGTGGNPNTMQHFILLGIELEDAGYTVEYDNKSRERRDSILAKQ